MKDFDSNRIYQTLGDEFKNIYIVNCEDQQIHTFKETLKLPGFSSCTSYNDAMNQYIDDRVYEKNRDMLRMALSFNSLFSRLEKTEHFNIHYQSKNDSKVHFMYSHFGRVMENGRLSQIIIGFANEDLDIRRNNIDMFNNALPSNGFKRKVLIVEDNEINREILKVTLEDDYDVLEAVNGEEGLNILSQYYKDISLILLDVVMPVCDGFEFLSRQKSDSLLASVPVIVTTGNNSQEDELKCLGLGAVDFITKPYNARIVKSRIDSVIKLRESSMTLAAIEKDELTGLYTRQAFYHHARTFTHFMTEEKFNVVILDVADFKLINGTYGTKKGNEVLVYLSNAFRYYVKNGLLTRYEGDQLLGLFHSKVKMDVERINRNINKIAEEAPIPNIRIKVGIYEDVDTNLSIPIICDRALMAEKSISKDFKTNVAFYTDELNQKQLAQRQMENDFKSAIANREFKVYYQPKYDVNTESIVGAEALVCWQKTDGTLISPGAFIPLFESDGLVVHLDEYVFESVCQFQKERMENKLPMVPISVNLSRASIHFSDVVDRYVDIVNQKQIPFECVPIELTESATLYSEKILEITDQLVNAGFTLHMDDFGSGYSSLTSLNELNFSTVKLDKSLIDYIDQVRGKKIVQQAIDLGHVLDMKVVAEGVESKEQKDCLKEMHCDMIQGFYYSKPLKQEDFIEKLRA
jgi:diguanylate cyclase (GGDEF)-like protein